MKIDLNLPGVGVSTEGMPRIAAGSVLDHIAHKVAGWTEAALKKTDPDELTEEEMLGLAIAAGCDTRTVVTGEASYRLELARPVQVAYIDGQWHVHQETRLTAEDD